VVGTKRVAIVMGTRPEAIKLAPVVAEMQARDGLEPLVICTAQHRQMLDQVLEQFSIEPDIDLDLMQPDQGLNQLSGRVLEGIDSALERLDPDMLLVQGDTTSAMAAALAAFHRRLPTGHVEAGLRSFDLDNPFPEEMNRRVVSVLASVHLAPTPLARQRLLAENVDAERIAVTGNTVVDALSPLLERPCDRNAAPLADLPLEGKRMLLVTSHRRESWGSSLENVCLALRDLVRRFEDVLVVYPVHLNPNVRDTAHRVLAGTPRVHLIPPVGYLTFIELMKAAHIILTDSGGVQEEAPTLRKPLLLLRDVTERPEAFDAGVAKIVGTDRRRIVAEVSRLLADDQAHRAMASGRNPYGDGRAARRTTLAVRRFLSGERPLLAPHEEFGAEPARRVA